MFSKLYPFVLFVLSIRINKIEAIMYCPMSKTCVAPFNWTLSDKDRTHVLHLHNNLRNEVAAGKTNLPSAADILQLSYSLQLEKSVACLTKACAESDAAYKKLSVGGPVHYNRYQWHLDFSSTISIINMSFIYWTSHIREIPVGIIKYYKTENPHRSATQLLWSKTKYIGCAAMEFTKSHGNFICAYEPGGNVLGERVYLAGQSGSNCKDGRGSLYRHLCIRGYASGAIVPRIYLSHICNIVSIAFLINSL